VGSKAGTYISSWGTWVGEKRKGGWGRSASGNHTTSIKKEKELVLPVQQVRNEKLPEEITPIPAKEPRPKSYNENIYDADANAGNSSHTLEVKAPHAAIPSKFHEDIEGDGPVPPPLAEVPVSETVAQEASESSRNWEEAAFSPVDAKERSHAVAEAVQAAATTPISP